MDINALYQDKILEYARFARSSGGHITASPEKAQKTAKAILKNPTCGDEVTIALDISNGIITGITAKANACAICEAATGLAMMQLPGMSCDMAALLPAKIKTWLEDPTSPPPFKAAEDLSPIRTFNQRHACMILIFEAARLAIAAKE